jgi:hypothetical protein
MRSAFVLVLLAACGDNAPPVDDGVDPVPTGRTITGSHLVNYRTLDKTVLGSSETDAWDNVIEAHVPDGDGWQIAPGTGHRDGSFEIPGVADGHFWLRVARRPFGETFYWTSADHVSFDEDVLGPENPPSGDDGDQLVLDVDGLVAWEDGDELAWFVPNDVVFDTNVVSFPPPDAGTTDLAGRTVDWTGRPLANVAAGEPAYVVQYRTQTVGDGLAMHMPLRAAQPTIASTAGTDAVLDTTLTTPATFDYHFAWARDAFEAQREFVSPAAGASYAHSWSVSAIPNIVDGDLWLGIEYPLATLADPSLLEDTSPLDLGTVAIANPYPASWLIDLHVVTFPVDFPLPDGTPQSLEGVVGQRRTDVTRTDAVTPMITPIRSPKVAGKDAFVAQTGVGVTPTLSWRAPATGGATSYQIRIIQAYTDPPQPYRPGWYVAAELIVPGDVTEIRLPADLLAPATTYAAVVRAFAQPGQDVESRPFQVRADAGFADTIIGPFTP